MPRLLPLVLGALVFVLVFALRESSDERLSARSAGELLLRTELLWRTLFSATQEGGWR